MMMAWASDANISVHASGARAAGLCSHGLPGMLYQSSIFIFICVFTMLLFSSRAGRLRAAARLALRPNDARLPQRIDDRVVQDGVRLALARAHLRRPHFRSFWLKNF